MKIDTNTWHYKLLTKLDFSVPSNLCPYIRKLVLAFGVCIFMLALILGLVFFLFMIFIWAPFFADDLVGPIIGIIAWLLLGSGLLYSVRGLRNEVHNTPWWLQDIYTFPTPKKSYSENIFIQYLVALHGRVCPSIEFVNNNSKELK